MPAKEITALRKSGDLEAAFNMAKAELDAAPQDIWAKRNLSWVYYGFLKQNNQADQFDTFMHWLTELKTLQMPADEKILYEQIIWPIGTIVFSLAKNIDSNQEKGITLLKAIKDFNFVKPHEGYSFLFKAFHKLLKESGYYIQFADWWDFENFLPKDYEKEEIPDRKSVMSIAEQAYIAYSKHLLPFKTAVGEMKFDKEKATAFVPKLLNIVETYPQFQFPGYFYAKLQLALGDKSSVMQTLLPFARKKRNDFWVWQILAEVFSNDSEKMFACYCKALSCKSPEEMLVNLRQKLAAILIDKKQFEEAKTEIVQLVNVRTSQGWRTPDEVSTWQAQDWFIKANANRQNFNLYKNFISEAESILYSDISEDVVYVEFVNSDKKVLTFIDGNSESGFFKYERFLKDIAVGDVLKVRFQERSEEAICKVYTADKTNDDVVLQKIFQPISGKVRMNPGQNFAFLNDAYINSTLITKYNLSDGMQFNGFAVRSYNKQRQQWGLKLV